MTTPTTEQSTEQNATVSAARARTAAAVRARRAGASVDHYAAEIALAWEQGDEDAFDAPAPRA